jgi:uncharacterized protein YrzB (UPF0473 family)
VDELMPYFYPTVKKNLAKYNGMARRWKKQRILLQDTAEEHDSEESEELDLVKLTDIRNNDSDSGAIDAKDMHSNDVAFNSGDNLNRSDQINL